MHQKINFLVESASTINFCGKPIHTFSGQAYQAPFKVEPTTGDKHDYKTCVGCQENYKRDLEVAKKKFELFPECCDNHKQLNNNSFFKKEDYEDFPEQFAEKLLFSKNHIINNIDKEDWFIEITNYLDYVIKSFGQTPKDCGEPLMVSAYIGSMTNFLKDNVKVFKGGKAEKLIDFFDHYYEPVKERETDLNILVGTYQKWLNIFPFDLSMFSHLRQDFESTLPILKDKPVYNPYLKAHRGYFLDKESLIKFLIDRTNHLLTNINTLKLYENGELTDTQKIKVDLIIASRKLKIDRGYNNQTKDEQTRYRKMLKEWFEDEKRFIDEITPCLNKKPDWDYKENIKAIINMAEFDNNFDHVPISEVYQHFKIRLVDKKHISDTQLHDFLVTAFDKCILPDRKIVIKNIQSKQKIIRIFYDYYKDVAQKPHGKQIKYASLLSDYFYGFKLVNVSTNFNK